MVKKSPHLDLAKHSRREEQSKGRASWSGAHVVNVADSGEVEIRMDGMSESDPSILVQGQPGTWAPGADVRVLRGPDGRVILAEPPLETPTAGAVHVGVAAKALAAHESRLAGIQREWLSDVEAARDAVSGATAAAVAEARRDLEASQGALAGELRAAERDIAAARSVADGASQVARSAQGAAGEAKTQAASAQSAASAAQSKAVAAEREARTGRVATSRLIPDNVLIGGNLIASGAVTAEKITASASLWAKVASFAKVTTQMLVAGGARITGELLADTIRLTSKIVAGNPDGVRAELDAQGFHVYRKTRHGQTVEAVSLGTSSSDYLALTDSTGATIVSIDDSGRGAFQAGAFSKSLTYRGRELAAILDDGPRGVVGWGSGWPWSGEPVHALAGEESLFDLTLRMEKGRLYRLSATLGWRPRHDNAACEIRLRRSFSASGTPSSPTSGTGVDLTWRFAGHKANQDQCDHATIKIFSPDQSGTYRWLVSAAYAYAPHVSLNYAVAQPLLIIEDVGPYIPTLTHPSKAIAPVGAHAPSTTRQNYHREYRTSWTRSWRNGAIDTALAPNLPVGTYGSWAYQSMIGLPDMTADLRGAQITNVALYIHFAHFYGHTGTASVGMHGATYAPGVFQSSGRWLEQSGWARGEGRWVPVPQNLWAGLQNGSYRGITLEAPSGSTAYYGHGSPDIILAVEYTK